MLSSNSDDPRSGLMNFFPGRGLPVRGAFRDVSQCGPYVHGLPLALRAFWHFWFLRYP